MRSRLFARGLVGVLTVGSLGTGGAASGPQIGPSYAGSVPVAVVNVSTEAQLQSAIKLLQSNTTIVLAPGTYVLTSTLWINGAFTNVGVRGATSDRDDVTLVGPGMDRARYGDVPYGIWVGGAVDGVTIENLTIRDVYHHAISLAGGTHRPRISNVRLVDAGERFIESAWDAASGGVDSGVVEQSAFEYTTAARDEAAIGVDIHAGTGWIIRDNQFTRIASSTGLAGPAVLASDGSRDTVTERNTIVNSSRGIAYGIKETAGFDHSGGIIRNNVVYRTADRPGLAGISLADSPNTEVANNTVFVSGTYGTPIEYRYAGTTGVLLVNNLLDGVIAAWDGAVGTERNNLAAADASLFVNAAAADLRLRSTATSAIDRGAVLANVTDDWSGKLRPAGSSYDIGADEYGASRTSYSISGRVIDSESGEAVSGATVSLGGARSATATTAVDGTFTFSGLAGHVDYTAAATSQSLASTVSFSSLAGNQSGATLLTVSPMLNHAPTVSLTSPSEADVFTAPASITVSATARDRDTSVSKVEFYAGATLIGTDKTSSYRITWSNVPAGSYSLTAVATDTKGLQTRSDPVNVRVVAPSVTANVPPTISITSPVAGQVSTQSTSLTITATASDSDGSVSKVDFYAGSTSIGTKSAAPYQITWTNAAAGTYSLTAVATDNRGASTRSAAVSVTITAPAAPIPGPTPAPVPPTPAPGTSGMWIPAMSTPWQWQLTGTVDQTVDVPMYDIDLFDNSAAVVASLKAKGRHVVCYVSAGTWEDWRSDAAQFPAEVKGNSNGWPGEKWLDIRRLDVLAPIMSARLDQCKAKGFDAVEPDNVDGYTNKSGFPLTAADQLAYNRWFATAAHSRGLSVGLKNDLDQVTDLVGDFDWALNEQCFEYNECSALAPFTKAGKAVFEVEYNLTTAQFCSKAVALQFNAMKKGLDLDAPRTACTP
jgi:hypothetical protein